MSRRLLLVHAHPDDETINCGATMAKYVAEGVQVTLVTCTLGEEGEILLPHVAHLSAEQADELGAHRLEELHAAMSELGVTDIRLLGGAGRWRDSGMVGTPSHTKPGAFVGADSSAVEQLRDIMLEVRPHVVVTYDSHGGYGHPDHIQAHRITHAAVAMTAVEGWRIAKVYACARVLESERADRERLRSLNDAAPFAVGSDDFSWAVPRTSVTTEIDGSDFLDAKRRAMSHHATQILVDGDWYALSDRIGAALHGIEYYTCEVGFPEVTGDFETDLFAGVDVSS